ncbi:MAG TPA: DPP IV N-terminal domain-containing protein [Chitinophaga sp.]|uniref:S9 family peptidase n=1 Tax=Chitinophaga sp. TaxID=1869181 RepID=UPI002DB891BE|nr:DPP IV N-terminal domain-containing protein [Chitinophaga sp.]HEU4553615.1 DPP IV N-terminal domain-containing protein [Chitinophaga sp.]
MPYINLPRALCLLLVTFLLLPGYMPLHAQGTAADYRRANEWSARIRNKLYYAPISFNWIDNTHRCWYFEQTPRGKEFIMVDADKHSRQPAFDQEKLARSLTALLQRTYTAYDLPFSRITFGNNAQTLTFNIGDTVCRCQLPDYRCQVVEIKNDAAPARYWGAAHDETNNPPVPSPDSNWVAYIQNYNVYIRNRATKEAFQLSYDGSAGEFYSSYIEWAPDGKKLAAVKIRPNKKHLLYLISSSPTDQLQPRLTTRDYLKPGDALPVRVPQLFLIDSKKHIPLDASLFSQQYSVGNLEWRKDSRAFTFEYNQRGHQVYRVLEADAATGRVRALITETSPTFIDYSSKKYRYDVNDGKEIIWASERDGWNHLYLYDGKTGQVKHPVTKGSWVVRSVVKVDEKERTIIFAGSGREPGQDPYLLQYYKTDFEGRHLQPLTTENAQHSAKFSDDYKYFIDTYSRVDVPPVTVLRNADGKVVMQLEKANISGLLQTGWRAPEVFSAKGRDGKTDIWGIIIRPSNFDASRKYPVIENIYAGPHSSFVPKTFQAGYRGMQELAELGFIVIQVDGMGTSNRSKAFHDVCWKNLKDAGFPDRILWMKAAAAKYPYMDITRVGIYGTSAGGQNAAGAVLFHPEFYKVAVASCGCHDNRMDKMWWNEQWMGWPIGPQYEECSNVTHAGNLEGKLMLILGEMDDNVDPSSTLQLVNALIKHNKDFDFVMVPGMGHSSGGDYGEQKRRDFFVRHLLHVAPPDWNDIKVDNKMLGSR